MFEGKKAASNKLTSKLFGQKSHELTNDDEALVKKIKNDLLALGVDSFMVFFPAPDVAEKDISIFEQIKVGKALPILLGAAMNLINQESGNTMYSAEYGKMFQQFLADLKKSCQDHNNRMQQFNSKSKE